MIFCCKSIAKNYENIPVIEDISLNLPQGGFISLLGPSGVGKTTLFNVLAGLDPPDAGNVYLNGEDITNIPGKVSYMPQKDLLLEHRTILDNVILPLLIHGEKKKTKDIRKFQFSNIFRGKNAGLQAESQKTASLVRESIGFLNKAVARESAAAFFPSFGLAGYEKKYPRQLSGGMRQRAALLRTCMPRKPVILLDEPFSALDAITRRQMQNWYREISQTMNLSTLFITHDVDEALLLSKTVYILNGKPGKISTVIEVSPHDHGQKQAILEAI